MSATIDRDAPLAQSELDAFQAASVAAYDKASHSDERVLALCIAGLRIDIRFAGEALYARMAPALAGCRVDNAVSPAAITLSAFDARSTGVAIPPPPRSILRFVSWRGDLWKEHAATTQLVFHYSDYTLQLFDPVHGTGLFMVEDAADLPFWSVAAPMRSLLAMALESRGLQLVHGAAVGSPDGAVLITGYGGSGKSTTALRCLAAGLGFAGDDYVVVAPGTPPRVCNLFASAKVNFGELETLPALQGAVCATEQAHQPKAVLLPFATDDRQLLRDAPLLAWFAASLGEDEATHIAPSDAEQIARVAFTSTALQIPYAEARARGHIEAAVVAPHELILGSDRDAAVQAIATFLDDRRATAPRRARVHDRRPPLSVVIPIHNGARFVRDAIASVAAQGYPQVELILVDDGSTDALDEALVDAVLSYKLIRQQRSGPSAARNAGILQATGELIAFLDVDDVWPEGNLHRLATELSLQPELHVVHGKAEIFYLDMGSGQRQVMNHVRAAFPFYLGAGLYRRTAFDRVGLFDANMIYGEDSDWYLRAYDKLRVLMLPEITLCVRNHDANMTLNKTPAEMGALHVLKRHLDRKRASKLAETTG